MMTPEEKAKDIAGRLCGNNFTETNTNKMIKAALICADELINAFKELSIEDSGTVFRDFGHGYWEEVKAEIEKL